MDQINMWKQSLQRGTFNAIYYCVIALAVSTISWDASVLAQGVTLEGLLEGIGKADNRLGSSGSSKKLRLPNGASNTGVQPTEVKVDESSNFELTPRQRLIVRRYCAGEVSDDDDRLVLFDNIFSRMEMDFCRRTGQEIQQFGYNVLVAKSDNQLLGSGAIQDHYVLGEGDQLEISFYGRESGSDAVIVDRQGRAMVRDLPPMVVAGMTFGEFRRKLAASVKDKKIGTEVYLSLGSVKSVSVTIAGEVRKPGQYQMTALSSVFDAVSRAEGIKKTGSLRRLQIFRGDQIFWIDLYDLLLGSGFSQDMTLRDGDRVVVPLIGRTVAIDGIVRRPGIYELSEGVTSITVEAALRLAGGGLRPQGNLVRLITFDKQGQEISQDNAGINQTVRGGDIVLLVRSKDFQSDTVELLGHVRTPGKRSLKTTSTIHDLVGDKNNLKDDPYLLFAILETTDPATRARRNFPINLRRILANEENFALRDGDRLIILGAEDVDFLNSYDVQKILFSKSSGNAQHIQVNDGSQNLKEKLSSVSIKNPNGTKQGNFGTRPISSNNQLTRDIVKNLIDRKLITLTDEQRADLERELAQDKKISCLGLRNLSALVKLAGNRRFRSALQVRVSGTRSGIEDVQPCPRIFNLKPDLLPFVLEHVVAMSGEIRSPGAYPITNATSLSSIIAVAGGLTRDVNLGQLEISRFQSGANIREIVNLTKQPISNENVSPGDVVRVNAVYSDRDSGPVRLRGEFIRPGLYDIRRGERLSDVIARAGGLTPQAYPYGSIFTRESVKEAQKVAFQRAARELRSSLLFAGGGKAASPQAMVALGELTKNIENTEPLGRIVMESDPTVLQVRPEFDTVLEAGDQIYVPKRPNSVLVIGDVLNPGALQFIAGTKVDNYVNQAGGLQQSADEDRMFLVYPNGVAQPVSVSVWNYNPVQVPPGSTIVVPKDPVPLDLFSFAKDITALLSQMAITAASLAVIGNN